MGVPKFFWYMSERYPCLSELVREFQIPDFDHLYLDMNGIIHSCSHPNTNDPHFTITEEKIFASIFHYIEVLFNIIKPRKLFFMAVDGVAPRAKMNQQRARRFRSAKEAELAEKNALARNEKLPENRFDSNCITPGTVFMDRLDAQLKYFITSKISSDHLWQRCTVIFSGHQTPGEGEHKIMDYIRYMKTLPDYDSNTRHCLYGLDADLIMLGLCTHEPHFSLLREKVKFGKKADKKITSPDEIEFYLLHLSLLREYLDFEFSELRDKISFEYNLENIIDDWVLMGFLVGNDFIPHLPGLHINKGAFPVLCKTYIEVLPTLDGYLNENGYLNFPRFQKYMEALAQHDMDTFEETFANLAFLESKMGGDAYIVKKNQESPKKSDLEQLIQATNEMFLDEEDEEVEGGFLDDDEGDTFLQEFCQHKKNYYTEKLEYAKVTEEVLRSQAEGYIRAIQWNLHYYYQGCQSWSWYYPHHYAPYISDIKDFKDLKLNFEMGKPFLPFQQLLAVLPAASKTLLPPAYQELMTSLNSPIRDFYPENFETDLNGKRQEWEAVVLIPFINEERLLEAIKPCNEKLTLEEKRRNRHGPMTVYSYTPESLGIYKAPQYFPTIPANHALAKEVHAEEIAVDKANLKYGLRPGVALDVLFPGFPTFKHIPHTAALKLQKVKVFDFPSKEENMIVSVKPRVFPPIEDLAHSYLGNIIYVNWPHLVEAKVVAIADQNYRYSLTNEGKIEKEEIKTSTVGKEWSVVRQSIAEEQLKKWGLNIGLPDVLVYVLLPDGWKYIFSSMGKVVLEKMWSSIVVPCALQVTVKDITVYNPQARGYLDFQEAFPVGSVVFMLGQPHFGSKGAVLDSTDCSKSGRLNVAIEAENDPVLPVEDLRSRSKSAYLNAKTVAVNLGIRPSLLNWITGSILIDTSENGRPSSKANIGLNLKFNKRDEEIPGYTKKCGDVWLYSPKAVDLVAEYLRNFPGVAEAISNCKQVNNRFFMLEQIFPGPDGLDEMKKLVNWIKQQEYNKVERVKCGSELLEENVVNEVEKILDSFKKNCFIRNMQVKPQFLYKNDLVFGNVSPVKSVKHRLLDRVVSIRSSYTVPTGARGFIIGIHKAPVEADYKYDILFDTPFVGGMTISSTPERAFRMLRSSFLNISDANREFQVKMGGKPIPSLLSKPAFESPDARPKPSAFVQWNNRPPPEADNERFKQMWSILQKPKPQEETTDVLKKLLKIDAKEKPVVEDPVKSFFDQVAKISGPEKTEICSAKVAAPLCATPLSTSVCSPSQCEQPVNVPQKKTTYSVQLFSYFQKRNLGQPRFNFLYSGNKVTAQVYFHDRRIYSGLPCDDKFSACESAALQVLGALGEISLNNEALIQMDKEKKVLENQSKLSEALWNKGGRSEYPVEFNRLPQQNFRRNANPISNNIPQFLPRPPSQWMGSSRNAAFQKSRTFHSTGSSHSTQAKDNRDKSQETQTLNSRKPAGSALEFVPLQAIAGKRSTRGKINTTQVVRSPPSNKTDGEQKKAEVISKNLSGPSRPTQKRRRPKIAANLALDPNLY